MKRKVFMAILAVMVSTTIGVGGVVFADRFENTDVVACDADDNAELFSSDEQERGIEIEPTNFPDPNFREFLESNDILSIKEGTGEDARFYVNSAVTKMTIGISNIFDIKGIEYFTNLNDLVISGQTSTEDGEEVMLEGMIGCLDLTKNPNLKSLTVKGTTVKRLDLSKSVNLKSLLLINNDIENLDITGCTNIETLTVKKNNAMQTINASDCICLKEIEISNSIDVTELKVNGCESLESLKVEGCEYLEDVDILNQDCNDVKSLKVIDLHGTSIATVDIKELPELETLNIADCKKCNKVLVQDCPLLKNFIQEGCKIKDLLLYNTKVNEVDVSNSSITKLYLKECPEIKKINANNCTQLKEVGFEKLSGLEILELQNTAIDSLNIDDSNFVKEVDVSGSKELSDLKFFKGADYKFSCLKKLDISGTSITTLDISGLQQLTDFNVKGCEKLSYLKIENCTSLLNLDINNCENLITLDIDEKNQLEKISLCGLTIEELNFKNFKNLVELKINNCDKLTSLKIENCPNLSSLDIFAKNNIKQLSLIGVAVTEFNLKDYNRLIGLEINKCNKLLNLELVACYNLSNLIIKDNDELEKISLDGLAIKNLDIICLENLVELQINNCDKLTCLNVEQCSNLSSFSVYKDNIIEKLTFFDVPSLGSLDLSNFAHLKDLSICYALCLEYLNIENCHNLSTLNLNHNEKIRALKLNGMLIEELKICNFDELEKLEINNCDKLSYLKLEGCLKMKNLSIYKDNNIETMEIFDIAIDSLDFSDFVKLSALSIHGCKNLTSVNLDNCSNLSDLVIDKDNNIKKLNLSALPIEKLDLSKFVNLNGLTIDDCQNLTSVLVTDCKSLKFLDIKKCLNLSGLVVGGNDILQTLNLNSVSVEKLNLSGFEALMELNVNDCQKFSYLNINDCKSLVCVDVSGCSSLFNFHYNENNGIKKLNISNTSIVECWVSEMGKLEEVIAEGCNFLQTIEIDGCKKLNSLSFVGSNNLKYIIISESSLKKLDVAGYKELISIVANDCNELREIIVTDCLKLVTIGASTENSMIITVERCPKFTKAVVKKGSVGIKRL